MKGKVAGIAASDYWYALVSILWDSAARIGEIVAAEWSWLNWDSGYLDVPAEVRKGMERDMCYLLHPRTLEALQRIKEPSRRLIFPGGQCEATLYYRFSMLLKRAGLPRDRKSMFHRIRRSVASHVQAKGFSACDVLKQSSPALTKRSYLDPRIVGGLNPCEILSRPDDDPREDIARSFDVGEVPELLEPLQPAKQRCGSGGRRRVAQRHLAGATKGGAT
jgi:hypothetical protein